MAFKLKGTFSKKGEMRYISHLDLVRLIHRAARRASLPVTVTKGFSPRLKISVLNALKLGVESNGEEAIFYMDAHVRPEDLVSKMNSFLPEGVQFIYAEIN